MEAGVTVSLTAPFNEFDDVPTLLATQVNAVTPPSNKWNDKRAKDFLCNNAAAKMTKPMIEEIDPHGKVRQWFQRMQTLLAIVQ